MNPRRGGAGARTAAPREAARGAHGTHSMCTPLHHQHITLWFLEYIYVYIKVECGKCKVAPRCRFRVDFTLHSL